MRSDPLLPDVPTPNLCWVTPKLLIYIDRHFLADHAKSITYRLVCNGMGYAPSA